MRARGLILPPIPPAEHTPTVRLLLAIIEQQQLTIAQLQAQLAVLQAEVAWLKKAPAPSQDQAQRFGAEPPRTGSGPTLRGRRDG